jgi:hypothetical protein
MPIEIHPTTSRPIPNRRTNRHAIHVHRNDDYHNFHDAQHGFHAICLQLHCYGWTDYPHHDAFLIENHQNGLSFHANRALSQKIFHHETHHGRHLHGHRRLHVTYN